MEMIAASVVTLGTLMIIEGVKRACKKQLERKNEDV
jgi:hypothetical protein